MFELRNEEINVKKVLAVINATYAVAKRKPEKFRLAGYRRGQGSNPGVTADLDPPVQIR